MDGTTLEWTDVFTSLLRRISDVVRRYWIVFGSDVDPEWAEESQLVVKLGCSLDSLQYVLTSSNVNNVF
jgi:hypothetical protein